MKDGDESTLLRRLNEKKRKERDEAKRKLRIRERYFVLLHLLGKDE